MLVEAQSVQADFALQVPSRLCGGRGICTISIQSSCTPSRQVRPLCLCIQLIVMQRDERLPDCPHVSGRQDAPYVLTPWQVSAPGLFAILSKPMPSRETRFSMIWCVQDTTVVVLTIDYVLIMPLHRCADCHHSLCIQVPESTLR